MFFLKITKGKLTCDSTHFDDWATVFFWAFKRDMYNTTETYMHTQGTFLKNWKLKIHMRLHPFRRFTHTHTHTHTRTHVDLQLRSFRWRFYQMAALLLPTFRAAGMCGCTCVSMCTCTYTHMWIRVCVWIISNDWPCTISIFCSCYVCMCVCVCVRAWLCVCRYMYMYMYMNVDMSVWIGICQMAARCIPTFCAAGMCGCTCVSMCTCTCTSMWICVCVWISQITALLPSIFRAAICVCVCVLVCVVVRA